MQYQHFSSGAALLRLIDAQTALVAAVANAPRAASGESGWHAIEADLKVLSNGIEKIAAIGHAPFREWLAQRMFASVEHTVRDFPAKGMVAIDQLRPALAQVERIEADLQKLSTEKFLSLAIRGDGQAIAELVAAGLDINGASETQRSPLHTYLTHPMFRHDTEARRERTLRLLLAQGAHVREDWLEIPGEPAIRALLKAAWQTQKTQAEARASSPRKRSAMA